MEITSDPKEVDTTEKGESRHSVKWSAKTYWTAFLFLGFPTEIGKNRTLCVDFVIAP